MHFFLKYKVSRLCICSIKTYFKTRDDYNEFINTITKRSIFNFNTYVNVKDKILTLSTCQNNNNGRIVVHAKLIKKQSR